MPTWSFLTNHGLVLTFIGGHPESTGLGIAQAVGITERAARTIVADLERAGYIEREKVGRRNRYRIDSSQPLQLLGERAVTVGELLALLWRDGQRGPGAAAPSTARAELNGRTENEREGSIQREESRGGGGVRHEQ